MVVEVRQRPVDLYGGGHLFRCSEIIFFGKNQAKLFIFYSTATKLFLCEVSHDLYFLDDSLFKCKSITPLLNWFNTISTYAAKLFFYSSKSENIFFSKKVTPQEGQLVAA